MPENFTQKNIFILGMGLTGIAAAKKLAKLGNNIFVYDDYKTNSTQDYTEKNIKFIHYDAVKWPLIDYIIISPGINVTGNKAHKISYIAQKYNKKLICDVELFRLLLPKVKIIAITGTNGKSTTTSLIYQIFKQAGKEVYIGGNIGISVFDLPLINNHNIYYILELSSYQLELIDQAQFDAAVILNITPDHISKHGSFANYVAAKFKIFKNSPAKSLAIISPLLFKANFCQKYLRQKQISMWLSTDQNKWLLARDCSHFGNKENLDAAINIAKYFNILDEQIKLALQLFKPLPHRLQYLGKIAKVSVFNDSKATNAESTVNAIKQFEHICLIIGGVAKAGGIKILLPYLARVKKIILIGEASMMFKEQLDEVGYKEYLFAENLTEAYQASVKFSLNYNREITLLFSPAAASFDMWQNFAARGDDFIKLFKQTNEFI